MASLLDFLGQHHQVYNQWSHTGKDTLYVSELSEEITNDDTRWRCNSFPLGFAELKLLLSASGIPIEKTGRSRKSVLRVIWIERLVQPQSFDVDPAIFKYVHDAVGHDFVQSGCTQLLAGIGYTNESSTASAIYYLNYLPKLSMTWSHSMYSNCTTLICAADSNKLSALQVLLKQPFVQQLHALPILPALLTAILFSMEIDKTQENVKQEVRRVEVRTGHHDWKSRAEKPALGDLVGLTAKMSGCSSRMASCVRKQKMMLEILATIRALQDYSDTDSQHVSEVVSTLQARSTAQQIDTDFATHRIKTQLDALYHLVGQNDAFSAQEMAQDTRLIAMASQHDSSSMKCIAMVTMFFLPGAFVSSLLSIPLFDWDGDTREKIFRSSYSKPILITFIAITLPIMALVFATWGVWRFSQQNREKRRIAKTLARLEHTFLEDEVGRLASRKRTLSSSGRN